MRIKITLLATLFMLLLGFQTTQAQERVKSNPTLEGAKISGNPNLGALQVVGVQGTISVALPLSQRLSGFKCSDIVVNMGQEETSQSGLRITTFKVVASRKATGDISSGKCSYSFPDSLGLQVKTYKISLGTNKNVPACDSIEMDFGARKSVTFPTGGKLVTIDFALKPSCVQIN